MLVTFRKNRAVAQVSAETTASVLVVVRPPAVKRRLTERVLGVGTVILIPGFLLASSIPALAAGVTPFGDDTKLDLAAPVAIQAEGQSVNAAGSAAVAITRNAFTAETHAQIAARRAANARAGAYSVVKPQQAGDDYPWRTSAGGLSPLRYVTRQCVDFVAWRINRDHGTTGPFAYTWSNMTPGGGSAYAWARAWNNNGWQTSTIPVPGAVAWFTGNHVAYVKSVNGDGTVDLEEYNWGGDASYNARTIPASSVALFLYPPP